MVDAFVADARGLTGCCRQTRIEIYFVSATVRDSLGHTPIGVVHSNAINDCVIYTRFRVIFSTASPPVNTTLRDGRRVQRAKRLDFLLIYVVTTRLHRRPFEIDHSTPLGP